MQNKINLIEFVNSYLATAAWVTTDSGECNEFTRDAKKIAKEECKEFINRVIEQFGQEKAIELLTIPGGDLGYIAAHDFFLTRNRHGAGFWDKDEIYGNSEADILTEICHSMGEADCYHIKGVKSRLTF